MKKFQLVHSNWSLVAFGKDLPLEASPGCYMLSANTHTLPGWKSRDAVPALVEDYLGGKVKVTEFVTHVLPLEKINEGFDLMHHGESIRAVITF